MLFCGYIFITLQERICHLSARPKTVFIMLVCLHLHDYLFITLRQRNHHLFHDANYFFITPKCIFIMLFVTFHHIFVNNSSLNKQIFSTHKYPMLLFAILWCCFCCLILQWNLSHSSGLFLICSGVLGHTNSLAQTFTGCPVEWTISMSLKLKNKWEMYTFKI